VWSKAFASGRCKTAAPRSSRVRSQLELLEDRLVPAVIDVNTLADIPLTQLQPGQVTLRDAIQIANTNGDATNTINLTLPGVYQITLTGTPGETDNKAGEFAILPTAGNLTIQNTSGSSVVVDGGGKNRVFDINPRFDPANPTPKFTVTLQGFTIENGFASDTANPDGPNASGGGIRDQGNASLTLNNVIVTNNSATADGGGISMENTVNTPWTLTLNNSTISNNHAGDAGGGIDEDGSGKVFVNFSTITGNSSVNQGAGIWLDAIQVGTVFQSVGREQRRRRPR
jgi:predicted outer membrane repeat protein